jgi:hemerythrin
VPLEWNESYAIGVVAIDAQHRELFARMASFEAALQRGDAWETSRTFAFLREYAVVHFALEEGLMREAAYPGAAAHVESHARFVERLAALSRELREGRTGGFLELRARNWITVWLLDHVGGEDVALGRHLRSRAA